jgi:tetratricopeptide (TPR) repeat protein
VNNADAHYNLGLLYKDVKQDPDKAIMHLSKYLELKPDAEDKEEVQGWIEKLK